MPNKSKFPLECLLEVLCFSHINLLINCYCDIQKCSWGYCPEIFVHLGSTYGPPRTPQIWKKYYFFHILGLNLKNSYQIASLFRMYIDMGERIAGKQDRPSRIIENPLRAPKIATKYIIFYILVSDVIFILFFLKLAATGILTAVEIAGRRPNWRTLDYFHILHIVELWCDFKMFVGPWSIYI